MFVPRLWKASVATWMMQVILSDDHFWELIWYFQQHGKYWLLISFHQKYLKIINFASLPKPRFPKTFSIWRRRWARLTWQVVSKKVYIKIIGAPERIKQNKCVQEICMWSRRFSTKNRKQLACMKIQRNRSCNHFANKYRFANHVFHDLVKKNKLPVSTVKEALLLLHSVRLTPKHKQRETKKNN